MTENYDLYLLRFDEAIKSIISLLEYSQSQVPQL